MRATNPKTNRRVISFVVPTELIGGFDRLLAGKRPDRANRIWREVFHDIQVVHLRDALRAAQEQRDGTGGLALLVEFADLVERLDHVIPRINRTLDDNNLLDRTSTTGDGFRARLAGHAFHRRRTSHMRGDGGLQLLEALAQLVEVGGARADLGAEEGVDGLDVIGGLHHGIVNSLQRIDIGILENALNLAVVQRR